MLKLAVPTRAKNVTATYEAPYGYVERMANGDENPGQKWLDVTGTVGRGKGGVTLLNDGKYGFDVLGGEMRMSVVRTPIYAFHDRRQVIAKETYRYPDLGTSRFRYALIPHAGDWRLASAPRAGEQFNTPLVAFVEPYHNGKLSKEGASFLEVGPENVVGTVLKRSQDTQRIIVRLYESHGKDGKARIRLPQFGISAEVSIGHHEIKTLAFDLAKPKARPVEVDLLERPIKR
jgi:alpha-mannosidase